MAKSAYEYVRLYEQDDRLLRGCWIVVRLDGNGFTKFCELHEFEKPNDDRALALMDAAAKEVFHYFPTLRVAFGESDEYSFVFGPAESLHGRRASKLVSLITSCFTGAYVRLWPLYMVDRSAGRGTGEGGGGVVGVAASPAPGAPASPLPLRCTPVFDGRAICYPSAKLLRDYLSWRQVDTHINNLYNTCFWALVKAGTSATEAHAELKGTRSDGKNEMLFSRFGVNYNDLPQRFRKGSVIVWGEEEEEGPETTAAGSASSSTCPEPEGGLRGGGPRGDTRAEEGGPRDDDGRAGQRRPEGERRRRTEAETPKKRSRRRPLTLHVDIIRQPFWDAHPEILAE